MSESPSAGRPRKKRPPPRSARVEAVERVTPGLLRITFGGPDLLGFTPPRQAAHIKLYFPPDDMVWPPVDADAPRPPSRTYTPRRFDPERGRLEVEFVLHGEGLASSWAEQARVGDVMTIGGPGGGYDLPSGVTRLVIVADDSAAPAAAMVLEALPDGVETLVLCEIVDRLEERPLSPLVACQPRWLHRGAADAVPGALLEKAVAELPPQPEGTGWWIACEAAAMRRIRNLVASRFGAERSRLHTRGYWKAGAANHPDHDYGDD
jgi:NADPH-dependent ferric siderophore reductase